MNLLTSAGNRALVGGAVWVIVAIVWRPSPFSPTAAALVLLLSPLVLLPLLLDIVDRAAPQIAGARWLRWAGWLQLPAALVLVAAFCLPIGLLAATLVLPWLGVTALLALAAGARILERRSWAADRLAIDAGLAFVSSGAGWALFARAGLRPLDFEHHIVLLTAVHFHYAGLVLPLLTGLAAQQFPGRLSRLTCWGVMLGVPLVAVGITSTQLGWPKVLESLVVTWTVISGASTAMLHVRLAHDARFPRISQLGWEIAGLALSWGVLLALAYGWRHFVPVPALNIPRMQALHGTANALGFCLIGTLAWWRVR